MANRFVPNDPARELLDKTLDRSDEVMAEGRDRLLDLRVPVDTRSDLPKAFAAAGGDLAQGRPVTFRTVVEGTVRDMLRTMRDEEAYRIDSEARSRRFSVPRPRRSKARSRMARRILACVFATTGAASMKGPSSRCLALGTGG